MTGQWLISLATVVVMRGRLEEALALREQAAPMILANPEPQAAGFLPMFDGYVELARRNRAAAAERFAEGADEVRSYNIESAPMVFAECARAFLLLADRERAEIYRDLDGSRDSIRARPLQQTSPVCWSQILRSPSTSSARPWPSSTGSGCACTRPARWSTSAERWPAPEKSLRRFLPALATYSPNVMRASSSSRSTRFSPTSFRATAYDAPVLTFGARQPISDSRLVV